MRRLLVPGWLACSTLGLLLLAPSEAPRAQVASSTVATAAVSADFTVFTYHDVVDDEASLTFDAITARKLAMQFDWLKGHGYAVVSFDDVLAAQRGERSLPDRAVMLTFDDGYRSFYTRVFPLLLAFHYPAVFSVVGSFLDAPPESQVLYAGKQVPREEFVSWAELREMQRSGLVEVGSHTYSLHTTVYANPQGGEFPAAVGQQFIRRRAGPEIGARYRVQLPQARFGDVKSILALPFSQYLALAIQLGQSAVDYAYDPQTGRYETDEEYKRRVRADLDRNSALLEAHLGARPRIITWPYGRWNEVTVAAAREAGMPISLTLDVERASVTELGRVGRFYAANDPDLQFLSAVLTEPPAPSMMRGLCVNMDELYAPTEEEQNQRLGRILDRVLAFGPSMVLLSASSDGGAAEGVYFSTDRVPVRADLFSRVAWQIQRRAGAEVYAWLPAEQAGQDPDTAAAVYGALARAVPFRGVGMGPIFLSAELSPGPPPPGLSRWDLRTPRRLREAQDRARLSERGRNGLRLVDAVLHYQPAANMLDVVDLPRVRPPAEVAVDAVSYLAVRWDGPSEVALRKLEAQGWLKGDNWGRLVYWSGRGVPDEWRRLQRAGLVNGIYCPERLLDRPVEAAARGAAGGAAGYPYRP